MSAQSVEEEVPRAVQRGIIWFGVTEGNEEEVTVEEGRSG